MKESRTRERDLRSSKKVLLLLPAFFTRITHSLFLLVVIFSPRHRPGCTGGACPWHPNPNPTQVFYLDGVQQDEITVCRGHKVVFWLDYASTAGHPVHLVANSNEDAFTESLAVFYPSNTGNEFLFEWAATDDTPSEVWYASTGATNMGGRINVNSCSGCSYDPVSPGSYHPTDISVEVVPTGAGHPVPTAGSSVYALNGAVGADVIAQPLCVGVSYAFNMGSGTDDGGAEPFFLSFSTVGGSWTLALTHPSDGTIVPNDNTGVGAGSTLTHVPNSVPFLPYWYQSTGSSEMGYILSVNDGTPECRGHDISSPVRAVGSTSPDLGDLTLYSRGLINSTSPTCRFTHSICGAATVDAVVDLASHTASCSLPQMDDFPGTCASVGSVTVEYSHDAGTSGWNTFPAISYECGEGRGGSGCLECPGGEENPCNGQGTCGELSSGSGACDSCEDGFYGSDCGSTCACNGSPCAQVGGACSCDSGTYDSDCKECPGGSESPCGPLGTCSEGPSGSGQCSCSANVFGDACDVLCPGLGTLDGVCSGSGACSFDGSDAICNCESGIIGSACQFECPGDGTCNGHGTCEVDESGTAAICECESEYEGEECEKIAGEPGSGDEDTGDDDESSGVLGPVAAGTGLGIFVGLVAGVAFVVKKRSESEAPGSKPSYQTTIESDSATGRGGKVVVSGEEKGAPELVKKVALLPNFCRSCGHLLRTGVFTCPACSEVFETDVKKLTEDKVVPDLNEVAYTEPSSLATPRDTAPPKAPAPPQVPQAPGK